MMTVRFPNGQAVQYNTACAATPRGGFTDLTDARNGWVAQVPNTCLIEFQSPCRVYNALAESSQSIEQVERERDDYKRRVAAMERSMRGLRGTITRLKRQKERQ